MFIYVFIWLSEHTKSWKSLKKLIDKGHGCYIKFTKNSFNGINWIQSSATNLFLSAPFSKKDVDSAGNQLLMKANINRNHLKNH